MTRLATHQLPAARLRAALDLGGLDGLPDADLLDRFARYGEHPAFDALLRRHGPMVYGVCRRVLANPADADDAFQATFLVLVRKAGSIRRADRLGPWLYGVAFKVAGRARARALRLAARQTEATDMIPDPSPEPPDWLPVLDAELSALPAKYREPLVLCELQGASRTAAAKALGIPEGTLSSRLARGRDLLRKRLLKHGTLLPAGGLAALFSAGGVGRAAIPAALLAKTSELAAFVGTGAASAGAVPAGAARLTDEVLRGMMLTKLRVGVGAVLAAALVAFGAAAALPGNPAGRPEKPKASPDTTAAKPQSAKSGANAPAIPDRDALQGLWVLDKYDLGKGAPADVQRQAADMAGKMQFLVAGDVWWGFAAGEANGVFPELPKLDPTKNPKWLDLSNLTRPDDFNRCIYELDGDKLRICATERSNSPRPAEFTTDDEGLGVMTFRREKLPPPAGEKALVGSWEGMGIHKVESPDGGGITLFGPTPRVEILDGFLFVRFPKTGEWAGGRYTVDTTKNPKWIDVDLVCPIEDKVTKLYGCYEVGNGRLRMALGQKRATRPLEFAEAPGVLLFAVGQTKEPLTRPVAVDAAFPAPKPKDAAPAPRPKPADAADPDEDVRGLMKAGEFDRAEDALRVRLAQASGLRAAEQRLLLAVCLIERAKGNGPEDGASLLIRAQGSLSLAVKELDKELDAGPRPETGRAAWVRTRCEIRNLQILHQQGKAKELLAAAEESRAKHAGTVEELALLSFVYHAYKQRGQTDDADLTRERMRGLFGKLKGKPDAFPEKTGEFSR
jgi:RNA polymerase sigma factor (sigma-70 family)